MTQIVDAKTVTVRGQIKDFDKTELTDIIILLVDTEYKNSAVTIPIDSLGRYGNLKKKYLLKV